MADIVISGDSSGSVTLRAPAVSGTTTLTLPTTSGTVLTTASTTGINASAITSGVLDQAYGGTGTTVGYNGFKNRLINGAMVIDQRNAGASVTNIAGYVYCLDRWVLGASQASKFTAQQNAGSVTPPEGFRNYLGATSSSAYTVGASEQFWVSQRIEGFNTADLMWGTASAKTVTLSFWVRSSLTGTFGGAINNSDFNRSYPFSYTISSANTWEQKTVTIAGDTTGTWLTTNGIGMLVNFSIGTGATSSGTAGAWAAGFFASATGAVSVVGTNGATFYITGVQLEKGSTATSFDYRPYGTELVLCQRYYQTVNNFVGLGTGANVVNGMVTAPIVMRTQPSFGLTGAYSISDYFSTDHTQSSGAISLFNATTTGAAISLTNFSGITSTRTYLSRFLNSNLITMSAEL
jgi:hypothetical protein